MKLKELGEFGFIDRIKVDALSRLYEGLVGIGDDCAQFNVSPGMKILLTTDMLVERIHFLREKMTSFQIGYKALAVNLSDIAACGGIPREAFISIAVPEAVSVEELEDIYKGMKKLARESDVNIAGGDTTGSCQDLIINIALTGEVEEELVLTREGACEGDWICVTNYLGDSAAGLDMILNNPAEIANYPDLVNQHFMPYPHLQEGRLIAESGNAGAMMDISDGLASDIRHICKASGTGAEIYENQIPLSESFQRYASEYLQDSLKTAIGVGEDYCLLVTIQQKYFENIEKLLLSKQCKLFKVGKIIPEKQIYLITADGEKILLELGGWDHFKEQNL